MEAGHLFCKTADFKKDIASIRAWTQKDRLQVMGCIRFAVKKQTNKQTLQIKELQEQAALVCKKEDSLVSIHTIVILF